jgi:hypothetical protein
MNYVMVYAILENVKSINKIVTVRPAYIIILCNQPIDSVSSIPALRHNAIWMIPHLKDSLLTAITILILVIVFPSMAPIVSIVKTIAILTQQYNSIFAIPIIVFKII